MIFIPAHIRDIYPLFMLTKGWNDCAVDVDDGFTAKRCWLQFIYCDLIF